MSSVVELNQVTKKFGKNVALDQIDLTIGRGTITGLMGANGSGKSTLLRHIIGLYLPTSGTVTTFGEDCTKLSSDTLAKIGYVHQEGKLLDWMSVRQQIGYVKSYYPKWDDKIANDFIERFDIDRKARIGKLSPGKRQQLAILLAIGHNPELLILDEPASALDPLARSRFLDLILEIIQNDDSKTVIISSHILSDIEKVIDRAVIMDSGHILRDCSFDELREGFFRVTVSSSEISQMQSIGTDKIIKHTTDGIKTTLIIQNTGKEEIASYFGSQNMPADIKPLPLEEIYKVVLGKAEYVL